MPCIECGVRVVELVSVQRKLEDGSLEIETRIDRGERYCPRTPCSNINHAYRLKVHKSWTCAYVQWNTQNTHLKHYVDQYA
jgi:hypothetical protein